MATVFGLLFAAALVSAQSTVTVIPIPSIPGISIPGITIGLPTASPLGPPPSLSSGSPPPSISFPPTLSGTPPPPYPTSFSISYYGPPPTEPDYEDPEDECPCEEEEGNYYTTTYQTVYTELCPTGGLQEHTYTVVESGATPVTPHPTYLPSGFTVTVVECSVCGEETTLAVTTCVETPATGYAYPTGAYYYPATPGNLSGIEYFTGGAGQNMPVGIWAGLVGLVGGLMLAL